MTRAFFTGGNRGKYVLTDQGEANLCLQIKLSSAMIKVMAARGKDLTTEQKKLILKLKSEGNSGGKIGSILGINRFTVCHFLKRNENKENASILTESARKSKCGRKRQSSERADRRLVNIVKVNRRNTFSDIYIMFNENTPQKLSKRTVQRRLHEKGYHRRAVKKTTTISKQNKLKRRLFCHSHLHWGVNRDWSRVIFSDEI